MNLVIFINQLIMIRIISFSIIDFDINFKLFILMNFQDYSKIDNEYNYSAND